MPAFRKRFGQHLLQNRRIAQKIITFGELVPNDTVLEIGPGRGILTHEILEKGAKLIAVEIDRTFCSYLTRHFFDAKGCSIEKGAGRFQLIEGDCLRIDWEKMVFPMAGAKIKIISNLPYYLTAPILFKIFEWRKRISLAVLTMQLEVAKRLVARPFSKDYGILSVAAQFSAAPSISFKIQPGSFFPPPKVTSAVVKMYMREGGAFYLKDEAHFFKMVKTIFNKRRKMLNNTLKDLKDIDKDRVSSNLQEARIEGTRRPETLSLEELHRLYRALYNEKHRSEKLVKH